jgi:hypothetical protein
MKVKEIFFIFSKLKGRGPPFSGGPELIGGRYVFILRGERWKGCF